MSDKHELAKSMLAVLVIDLEYDYQPVYGHHPIRHQMAWLYAEKILGKAEVEKFVSCCKREVQEGHNEAVKTNPSKIRPTLRALDAAPAQAIEGEGNQAQRQ